MSGLETIYLVHHSHTDIGYTHDQPVVWEAQRRFLDAAVDACEADLQRDDGSAFRWTVEATSILLHWLRHASDLQVDRLLRLVKEGRIEVTGMFANLTPLVSTDQLIESLQAVGRLRADYGIPIRHAMNCDVNGQNWPLTDALLDAGIEAFSMAINEYFGGAPLRTPSVFQWEAPSGRRLLTLSGWHYQMGRSIQIGGDIEQLRDKFMPVVERRLKETGWPLSVVMMQTTDVFGDNGSADFRLGEFIRDWEKRVGSPHIRLATPAEWWNEVRRQAETLPVYRGDWTDYWNFGSVSSAREVTINRESRSRLTAADQFLAYNAGLQSPSGGDTPGRDPAQLLSTAALLREEAWQTLNLFDEHTWGADFSVKQPENPDTVSQWMHKAHLAYQARSLSFLLQRDGVAELSLHIPRKDGDALIVYNPLPWKRLAAGPVTLNIEHPRGRGDDPAASRHYQDRTVPGVGWWLTDVEVPGAGYAVVARTRLVKAEEKPAYTEDPVLENKWHRITLDRLRGGVTSWHDKRLGIELVDASAGWNLGGFIYERVADTRHEEPRHLIHDFHYKMEDQERGWKPGWRADRWGTSEIISHRVFRTPVGIEAVQVATAREMRGPVTLRVMLADHSPVVEFSAEWDMGVSACPEATYLAFPFDIPEAIARFDVGGQAIRPESDQLPGCCRDYFTVQGWVDFSNNSRGVTIACPGNPMVQLGGFHFGRNQDRFTLERALLLGWVTNNYWDTNFRASQPGRVTARYLVLPHQGGFDEPAAHRFGLEAAAPPVLQMAFEPPRAGAGLPDHGSMLVLPEPPILVLHVSPTKERRSLTVRLLNASDQPRVASIGSALLKISSAENCDLFGVPEAPVAVTGGTVRLQLQPRRIASVRLGVSA